MTPTKQFSWKDRETAGHDLIQLAYYAPPFISLRAIELLPSIRSKEIIPELVAITLDEKRELWQRTYALRAIGETEEDFFFPQLEAKVRTSFANADEKTRSLTPPYPVNLWIPYDFAVTVNDFVSRHSSNQKWFLAVLDEVKNTYVLARFLTHISHFSHFEPYTQELMYRLRQVLDTHPELLSLYNVSRFYQESETAREWCDKHFELIFGLCVKEANSWTVWRLANKWDRLREALTKSVDGWEIKYTEDFLNFQPREKPEFQASLLQNFLEGCYLSALEGNHKTYSRLVRAARLWKGFIPFRAVATYYLGKLQDHYEVFPILSSLSCYANDNWGDDADPLSPIRYEAGRALSNKPSPASWQTIIEAFFIKPTNDLSRCQLHWIRYMTDVLSGDAAKIGEDYSQEPIWFRALAEVSTDEAKKLIESVS